MEQTKGIELLPLIQKGDEFLIDGRLLHQALRVGKNFRHWIAGRIEEYNFEEGKDFFRTGYAPGSKKSQVSKSIKDAQSDKDIKNGMKIEYSITLDMAKELAMIERSETGRVFRRYFIAKEKEARVLNLGMSAPENYFSMLPMESINGHKLYSFTPLMKMLGYNPEGGTDKRKANYPNHFMKIGGRIYVTEAYAKHLFKSSLIIKSRRAIKAMQPILGPDFGKPIELELKQNPAL